MRSARAATAVFVVTVVVFALWSSRSDAQAEITDVRLEAASAGRVVRLGPASGRGRIEALPIEVYVARVLAGESEPRAPEAAQQALAIAIRTFALANAGRHARDGFDLCDGTHCQVPRPATSATRRAALATAGQLLVYNGAPAELFYSASCGGYSESAAQLWPGVDYPYLPAAPDEVHADEAPWMLDLTLPQVERALERVGFDGRLRDVRVEARTSSGRAARLQLPGLVPDMIAGDQFRAAIGATTLRSTAFAVSRRGGTLRFTGRGFGHGVGMCVIGAGRRARRGEGAEAILARYYPGLALSRLDGAAAPPVVALAGSPVEPPAARARGAISVLVPSSSSVGAPEVQRLTTLAHQTLGKALGVSVAPITVRVHESVESFRQATGRPWWVSSVSDGTSIDLMPPALLAQRDGLEVALRVAVADLLVAPALEGKPLWVRAGAARYFAHGGPPAPAEAASALRCPVDAELTLAVSAAAQREAEARAETCFARAFVRTRDWRTVR